MKKGYGNPHPMKDDHNDLEEGFVALGSPNQYPVDDHENKPEKPRLTSRDSRLHSDGNSSGCCNVMPFGGSYNDFF